MKNTKLLEIKKAFSVWLKTLSTKQNKMKDPIWFIQELYRDHEN